jgi:hypothetical protein
MHLDKAAQFPTSSDSQCPINTRLSESCSEEQTLTQEQRDQLDQKGFFCIENFLTNREIVLLKETLGNLLITEGIAANADHTYSEPDVERLGNLIGKDSVFTQYPFDKKILEACTYLFGEHTLPKLMYYNARNPTSSFNIQQTWHIDGPNNLSDVEGYNSFTVIIYLDDSSEENGATKVKPGSHKDGNSPSSDCRSYLEGEEIITAKKGTALFMNGHLWHAGGARAGGNTSSRMSLLLHYYSSQFIERLDIKATLSINDNIRSCLAQWQLNLIHTK